MMVLVWRTGPEPRPADGRPRRGANPAGGPPNGWPGRARAVGWDLAPEGRTW